MYKETMIMHIKENDYTLQDLNEMAQAIRDRKISMALIMAEEKITEEEIIHLVYHLRDTLLEYERKELAILLLSTTLGNMSNHRVAEDMVAISNESKQKE